MFLPLWQQTNVMSGTLGTKSENESAAVVTEAFSWMGKQRQKENRPQRGFCEGHCQQSIHELTCSHFSGEGEAAWAHAGHFSSRLLTWRWGRSCHFVTGLGQGPPQAGQRCAHMATRLLLCHQCEESLQGSKMHWITAEPIKEWPSFCLYRPVGQSTVLGPRTALWCNALCARLWEKGELFLQTQTHIWLF